MTPRKNKSGLTEAEVESAMEFADAAQYLAGGLASDRAKDFSREVLRGSMDADATVEILLAEILATGERHRCRKKYTHPGADVLINIPGVWDQRLLKLAEEDLAGIGLARLRKQPIPGSFDFPHLQRIHRRCRTEFIQAIAKKIGTGITADGFLLHLDQQATHKPQTCRTRPARPHIREPLRCTSQREKGGD